MRHIQLVTRVLTTTCLMGCTKPVQPTVYLWEGELIASGGGFDSLRGSVAAISDSRRTQASIRIEGAEEERYLWRIRRGSCVAPGPVVGSLAAYRELLPDNSGGATVNATLSEPMPAGSSYHAILVRGSDESTAACGALLPA